MQAWWNALMGGIGAVVGCAPHVLHHVGLLAGTALVAGTGGSVLFGVLGMDASVPFLLRLRRRFDSWWALAFGRVAYAVMFSVSTFLIDPAISGGNTRRRAATSRALRSTTAATTNSGHQQQTEPITLSPTARLPGGWGTAMSVPSAGRSTASRPAPRIAGR